MMSDSFFSGLDDVDIVEQLDSFPFQWQPQSPWFQGGPFKLLRTEEPMSWNRHGELTSTSEMSTGGPGSGGRHLRTEWMMAVLLTAWPWWPCYWQRGWWPWYEELGRVGKPRIGLVRLVEVGHLGYGAVIWMDRFFLRLACRTFSETRDTTAL